MFASNLSVKKIDASQIAARVRQARNKPSPYWIFAADENNGKLELACLAADITFGPPLATITATGRRDNSAANDGNRSL